MTTLFKLYDGRMVSVEHTNTGISASVDGGEPRRITSEDYMSIVLNGNIVSEIA